MLKKISKRERYALYLAAGFICIFVLTQFAVLPVIDKQKHLRRVLEVKAKTLEEMIFLKSEYDTIIKKDTISKRYLNKRKKGFTLFSFLDTLASETGLKDRIIYMKPSTSMQKNSAYKTSIVEMKLQNINLKQLTTYLYQVETSDDIVFIKRISISKSDKKKGGINAVLHVETIDI